MALRLVNIVLKEAAGTTAKEILSNFSPKLRYWATDTNRAGFSKWTAVMDAQYTQSLVEEFEEKVLKSDLYQIVVCSAEAAIPAAKEAPETDKQKKKTSGLIKSISYEELYTNVSNQAQLNLNFIMLVILSTIVAVIGIISNNIPILIGAMLIAPLLGPNLALALSTILFDLKLMRKALLTNLFGIVICLIFSAIIGFIINYLSGIDFSGFLIDHVTYSSIILAIASGAAAALYLLSGAAGSLVGIMVATALLPPTTVTGIALSIGHFYDALSAFLLLIVNIVCISLAANVMFLIKGVKPQSWYKKQRAKYANMIFMATMIILLLILFFAVYFLLRIQ